MACHDPSLTHLNKLGYNVLRYPRADTAPLDLLTRSGKDLVRLGPIGDVFTTRGKNLPSIEMTNARADISGRRTGKLDSGIGLTLMGTFFSALGGDASLKLQYKSARYVVFSYEDVSEEFVELTELDAFLSQATLRDNLNTVNRLLESDDVYAFTRVLKTKKLGVAAMTGAGLAIELDLPIIQEVAGGKLKVHSDREQTGKLVYEGSEAVAFGFQVVRLLYEDGHFRLEPVKPGTVAARGAKGRGAKKSAPKPVVFEMPLVSVTDELAPRGEITGDESRPKPTQGLDIPPPEPLSVSPYHAPASAESLIVPEGAAPEVQTVIYIHGIGNKPIASVLKCQWDRALFNVDMGDRTRMAYWVNRDYYPIPQDETCSGRDLVRVDDEEASTKAIMSLAGARPFEETEAIDREIRALTTNPARQDFLRRLAHKLQTSGTEAPAAPPQGAYGTRVLPPFMRRLFTEKLTRAFLRDVSDFLFEPDRRRVMERSLLDRIEAGGGPFAIVAHSQGTMIAYDVLRRLTEQQCDVRLFVTMGSPLGLEEVKDLFKEWTPGGELAKPACVTRWVNVVDKLDPVSADWDISNEYTGGVENHARSFLNPDSPWHPHSATGYLRSEAVQQVINTTLSQAFRQPIARVVIAKDLVRQLEDGGPKDRQMVLIQLATDSQAGGSLEQARHQIVDSLTSLIEAGGGTLKDAELDCTKRFVAARLTRFEVERLRARYSGLQIERVWRNAKKQALICQSTHTIQARPANDSYGANGENIGWAVLDTGIRGDHPHFEKYQNIVAQWDCTKPGEPVQATAEQSAKLDGHGHGTHVAGIIAGEYEIPLDREKPPLKFAGMAPRANLHGFKVLNDQGDGQDSWIIKALDKIAELNEAAGRLVMQGVNLSLGGNFDPSVYGCGHTPLCQELRRLWRQGVLVCLAAGNEGYALLQSIDGELPSNMDLSIGDPANLDEAIAVGSVHRTNPHTYGVSYFSSRGPTADGRRKPDLVAPGEQILSAYHQWKPSPQIASDLYVQMSGTSMAAPHVSGVLAAFLSLRREFIAYPDRVKAHLLSCCTDLGRDPYIQGWGMPNLIKMLAGV